MACVCVGAAQWYDEYKALQIEAYFERGDQT